MHGIAHASLALRLAALVNEPVPAAAAASVIRRAAQSLSPCAPASDGEARPRERGYPSITTATRSYRRKSRPAQLACLCVCASTALQRDQYTMIQKKDSGRKGVGEDREIWHH